MEITGCHSCSADLREAVIDLADSGAIRLQVEAEQILAQGWGVIDGWAFQRPFLYFEILRQVVRILTNGKRAARLRQAVISSAAIQGGDRLNAEFRDIEYLTVADREFLMMMAGHLMTNWPYRFTEICATAGVWWSWAKKENDNLPFAYEVPVKAALFRQAYIPNVEETRAAVLYLMRQGKYLAYTKRILFIVSAGNIPEPFEIEGYTDLSSFRNAPPPKRQKDIVMGLDGSKARRGMLTPAEQINGLTVAATHADASQVTLPANAVDPYDRPLPNLCSGMGLGFRRSVKPDISAPGGRMVAQPTIGTPFTVHGHNAGQYGQLAACPDDHGALVDRVRRCVGTSNAAALTTRAAVQIADALDFSLRDEPIQWRDRPTSAVMLKALVAHSARWGQAGAYLEGVLPPGGWKQWRPRRENVTRHIGYGGIDPDLVMSGTDHRITLLGEGEIRKEQRHPYFVPLPQELSAKRDFRRIIVTLAWMTPVKASSQHYRMVGLELVPEVRGQPFWPGIKRIGRIQPPGHMGREGTLIHSIYEGEEAQPILASSGITFNVQAWSRISGVSKIDIPYAIAITVEVADTLNADIYNSVRNRLRPRLRPRL
jgi:hypothetical protein